MKTKKSLKTFGDFFSFFIPSKINELYAILQKNFGDDKDCKDWEILNLFYRLWHEERVSKQRFMNEFEIVEHTFERYLQEIRSLLADCYSAKEL